MAKVTLKAIQGHQHLILSTVCSSEATLWSGECSCHDQLQSWQRSNWPDRCSCFTLCRLVDRWHYSRLCPVSGNRNYFNSIICSVVSSHHADM